MNAAIKSGGAKVTKTQSFECRDGWAYIIASTACGTSKKTAKIPAALYDAACNRTF